jgi:hypothetical protein
MFNDFKILIVKSFGTSRFFCSSPDKEDKLLKSPFVPRAKTDLLVKELSVMQKTISSIKATLTQRRIEKSKFDFDRISSLIDKQKSSLLSLSNYTLKASQKPKVKDMVEVTPETSGDSTSTS